MLVLVQTEDIKTRVSVQTQDINTNTRVPAQTQDINTNARVSVHSGQQCQCKRIIAYLANTQTVAVLSGRGWKPSSCRRVQRRHPGAAWDAMYWPRRPWNRKPAFCRHFGSIVASWRTKPMSRLHWHWVEDKASRFSSNLVSSTAAKTHTCTHTYLTKTELGFSCSLFNISKKTHI